MAVEPSLEASDRERIDAIAIACGFAPADLDHAYRLASEIIEIKSAEIAALKEAAMDAVDEALADGVETGLKAVHLGR